jgi:hypothetical protein
MRRAGGFVINQRRLVVQKRGFSSNGAVPVVELREYALKVDGAAKYLDVTAKREQLRKMLTPLRLFCMPDTGGSLNVATHFYYYSGGLQQRDEARSVAMKNDDWKAYLGDARPLVLSQQSNLYVEAPLVEKFQLCGMKSVSPVAATTPASSSTIYEIRKYQLHLGYDLVPKFLSLYEAGLPSKLAAPGSDPSSQLCTVLYTEVGELNNVIEIWRHGGGAEAMSISRVAARQAAPWRDAINNIAKLSTSFKTTLYRPTPFSSWK